MKTKIAKTILLAVLAGAVSAGTLNDGLRAPGKLVLERPAASVRPKRSYSWVATKPDQRGKVKFNGKKHKPDDFMYVCANCGKTYCHKCVKERPKRGKPAAKPAATVLYGKWSVKFNGKSKYKPDDFMQVCTWCGKTYCHKCGKTAQDAQCSSYGHSWYFVPAKKSGKHKH